MRFHSTKLGHKHFDFFGMCLIFQCCKIRLYFKSLGWSLSILTDSQVFDHMLFGRRSEALALWRLSRHIGALRLVENSNIDPIWAASDKHAADVSSRPSSESAATVQGLKPRIKTISTNTRIS